jgi:thiol:disulfide interchange protein DsbC
MEIFLRLSGLQEYHGLRGIKVRREPRMKAFFCGLAVIAVLAPGLATETSAQQQDAVDLAWAETLRIKLTATLVAATNSNVEVVAISETPFTGLMEVELSSGEKLFSDREGNYLVTGDLFMANSDGLVNLSALGRQEKIVDWISAVPEDEMVIFVPEETKASVTVFTDVDCGFCRRLHGDIDAILALGIQVRYVAYPRGGEASTAYPKMISVWCAEDRKRAIAQAKNGQNIPSRDCENPVLEHYNLGNRIGISGTPALVLEDGSIIPGYLEPERLAEMVLGQ